VVQFGSVEYNGMPSATANAVASLVSNSENAVVPVWILRKENSELVVKKLHLIPQQWAGRGLLGCHLVPFKKGS